jgi:hypothetical protein
MKLKTVVVLFALLLSAVTISTNVQPVHAFQEKTWDFADENEAAPTWADDLKA